MAIQHDLELVFPAANVPEPIICAMAREHDVVFNIVSANVSRQQGLFRFMLIGDESIVEAAEQMLREHGVEVSVLNSSPYEGTAPARPRREVADSNEPTTSKKLWITFLNEQQHEPITWRMACRFDVSFDVRQSSTGEKVSIMAILIKGPVSQVVKAIAFFREQGAEVEPIEKTVIEG